MKIEINAISQWEVAAKTDFNSKYCGRNDMIKMMKEIYPVVKEHLLLDDLQRFEDARNVPLHDAFEFFLEAIENGMDKANIHYEIYKDLEGIYRIKLFRHEQVLDSYNVYWMPMSWLPIMRDRNPKYFELIYALYTLLNRNKKVAVYGDDGYDEYIIEDIEMQISDGEIDLKDPEHCEMLEELKLIRNNYDMLTVPTSKMSLSTLKKKVKAIKPTFSAEKMFKKWLEMGIKVLETPGNMWDICENSERAFCAYNNITKDSNGTYDYEDGSPVLPYEVIRFTAFSSENISSWQLQRISDHAGNFGEATYCYTMDANTADDLYEMITSEEDLTPFLKNIAEFLRYGWENYDEIVNLAKNDWKQKIIEPDGTESGLSTSSIIEGVQAEL